MVVEDMMHDEVDFTSRSKAVQVARSMKFHCPRVRVEQCRVSTALLSSSVMSNGSAKAAPRVSFAPITPNNLGTVRKLNSVLFPIKYSEKFYKDILLPEVEDFCQLGAYFCALLRAFRHLTREAAVYYNDIPVGRAYARVVTPVFL